MMPLPRESPNGSWSVVLQSSFCNVSNRYHDIDDAERAFDELVDRTELALRARSTVKNGKYRVEGHSNRSDSIRSLTFKLVDRVSGQPTSTKVDITLSKVQTYSHS